jgi:argininosuccinate lyase
LAKQQQKPWGGVFSGDSDPRVERFSESVSFDHRLYAHDITGSIAHARMLAETGMLTGDERDQIVAGLQAIRGEIEAGDFTFRQDLEDVHMNIERALIDRIGDIGRKLHTGRSRNDQVSTDFRLWIREAIDRTDPLLANLQRAFVDRCDRDYGIILPGYTHLQRAQPVLANHYWLAYTEKFQRDRDRLADCRRRVNQLSPAPPSRSTAGTSLSSSGSKAWSPTASIPRATATTRSSSPSHSRSSPSISARLPKSGSCGPRSSSGSSRCRTRTALARRSCRRRSTPTCWN